MTRAPKLMPVNQAVIEGERWLQYLEAQEARAKRLAELAAMRRAGTLDAAGATRELAKLEERRSLTVYDGAELAKAVESLIAFARRSVEAQ